MMRRDTLVSVGPHVHMWTQHRTTRRDREGNGKSIQREMFWEAEGLELQRAGLGNMQQGVIVTLRRVPYDTTQMSTTPGCMSHTTAYLPFP